MRKLSLVCLAWMMVAEPACTGPKNVNSVGVKLPADAAPAKQQVLTLPPRFAEGDQGVFVDWSKTIWKSAWHPGLQSEPLVELNGNYEVRPLAAERWTVSEDGLTWTFTLRKGLQWSDGTPLTAHDFEFTVKRLANPETGHEAPWYFGAIKNLQAANEGKATLDDIGVKAVDASTLQVTTSAPTPFLAMLLADLYVVPKHIVSKLGDAWSQSPETAVSAGPFKLARWEVGKELVFVANAQYRGIRKPYLERIVYKLTRSESLLPAYAAGEIDAIPWPYEGVFTSADIAKIEGDAQLKDGQSFRWPDFMTWELDFGGADTAFKDARVRKAFALAIDKQALIDATMSGTAVAAAGFVPPGFHCYNPERLKGMQGFDPESARKLLAEAGYAGGKGFPSYDLFVRAPSPAISAAAEKIRAMLKENLGIEVGIQSLDRKVFMDRLKKHELPLALVGWAFDYYDASNFLGVYRTGGRHPWSNVEFDKLVDQANAGGDDATRCGLYQKAEELLVQDPGAVFLWHPVVIQLKKPWVKGEIFKANKFGVASWPQMLHGGFVSSVYIGTEKQP